MAKPSLLTVPPRDRGPGGLRTFGLVFLAALAVLWIAAGPREITKNDEHRCIAVAREMVVSGEWLVCRLNGETYAHKPPGWYWFAALANVLGASWTTAAMIPSVLGAAGAVTLVFDLARRLNGRVAAWAAAAVLLTTKGWLTVAVRGQLDPFLGFWTTAAAYAFARAVLFDAPPRARTAWTAAGFLAAGCGLLVKGPVALAIPGAAALVALLWDDRWSRVPAWRWALGLALLLVPLESWRLGWVPGPVGLAVRVLLFGAVTSFGLSRWGSLVTWRWTLAPLALLPGAIWAVAAAGRAAEGWGYVESLALGHGVAHAAGQVDKIEPWWFYAKALPVALLPWTLLLPAAVWAWRAGAPSGNRLADRFAMAWLVAPVVLLSLSPAKRDVYLFPVLPAAALLVGRLAAAVAEEPSRLARPVLRWGLRGFGVVGVVLGALLAAVGVLRTGGADGWIAARSDEWAAGLPAFPPHLGPAAIVLGAALSVASVLVLRARTVRGAGRSLAGAAAALVVVAGAVYAPVQSAIGSPRPFLERVRERIGGAPLGDYGGTAHAANWICERIVVPDVESPADAARFVAESGGPAYLCVDRRRLEEKGIPPGMRVELEDASPGPEALVLLGVERPAPGPAGLRHPFWRSNTPR